MTPRPVVMDKLALHAPHLSQRQYIPAFVYGTAWKKEATTNLVYQALSNGFTGIDTANQPKHYREDLVANGLRHAIADNLVKRASVYVQTKFTPVSGQDPNNIPYDPASSLTEQVKQSVRLSLQRFAVPGEGEPDSNEGYLDAVVVHSPMSNPDDTLTVWRTLESYVPSKILHLGISNCGLPELVRLYERANIKPAVVQNRFYPGTGYDVDLRRFCEEKGIVYQSFWTLSANPKLVRSRVVTDVATRMGVSPQSALYCLVHGLGNTVILNGTTSEQHMRDDWAALSRAKSFAESQPEWWNSAMRLFKELIR